MSYFRTPPRIPSFDYRAPASHFVTFCTRNRRALFLDGRAAEFATKAILDMHAAGRFYLYAYCVMPDHVHLFVRLRDATVHLSRLVRLMKFRTSRAINQPGCWQRGYWEKVIRGFENPGDVVKYILLNPVRAGLANEIGIYPYCKAVDPWF